MSWRHCSLCRESDMLDHAVAWMMERTGWLLASPRDYQTAAEFIFIYAYLI